MNMGSISTWKLNHCWNLLKNWLLNIEERGQRKELNNGLKSGLKRMSEGYDQNLLDVNKMIQES